MKKEIKILGLIFSITTIICGLIVYVYNNIWFLLLLILSILCLVYTIKQYDNIKEDEDEVKN